MTEFILNAPGTTDNPWKTSETTDVSSCKTAEARNVGGDTVIVGKGYYDLYKRRPPLPRVPTGQFAARIPKTVKHYLDPIKIAWELTNQRVPLPNVLRHGAGSITERNI